jgi:hypothetical protein
MLHVLTKMPHTGFLDVLLPPWDALDTASSVYSQILPVDFGTKKS